MQVGLDFTHFIGATGQYYLPEIMGPGVALFDYDNDNDLDVLIAQGNSLGADLEDAVFPLPTAHWPGARLFQNRLSDDGDLRFIDVTDSTGLKSDGYGMGITVGDYDNDGNADVYLTNFGGDVLYRNQGDGTFVDVTEASGTANSRWSASAAFLDYDNDGDLDLFVTNYVKFALATHKKCTSALGYRDYCSPGSYSSVEDTLFQNQGDGAFIDVSNTAGIDVVAGSGLGVSCVDFDRDGLIDIYVANDQQPNHLWVNQGDGSFLESALGRGAAYNMDGRAEASMGVTAADFDGDGDEDLFMTHLTKQTNTLYLNDGKARFVDATDRFGLGQSSLAATGFGAGWFDYDNDGVLDLFAANGAVLIIEALADSDPFPYRQTNQLFRSGDDGRFQDISARSGAAMQLSEVSRGAAFGDIDNDGDIDIVVTNTNGPARLLLNEIGNRNRWLRVRLRGTTSNRDGVGARVALLRKNEDPVWRRAHSDGSYLSASDIRVHFGLDSDTALVGIGVQWPGGRREMWTDIEPNQEVVLVEGDGHPWNLAE